MQAKITVPKAETEEIEKMLGMDKEEQVCEGDFFPRTVEAIRVLFNTSQNILKAYPDHKYLSKVQDALSQAFEENVSSGYIEEAWKMFLLFDILLFRGKDTAIISSSLYKKAKMEQSPLVKIHEIFIIEGRARKRCIVKHLQSILSKEDK